MAKHAAVKTGISMGIMMPSAQSVVLEGHCVHCGDLIRLKANGCIVGRAYMMTAICGCGMSNKIATIAKELDS